MSKSKTYSRRTWLNKPSSPSTGCVVCYSGPKHWKPNEDKHDLFLQVSSCTDSARLHMTGLDTKKDFVNKLKKLRDEVDKFIEFIEEQPESKY